MPPAKPKPEQLLDLLIAKGPALREAGFLVVELDGCKFEMAAFEPEVEVARPTSKSEESMRSYVDALDDPMTSGSEDGTTGGFYDGRRQGPLSNDGAMPLDG